MSIMHIRMPLPGSSKLGVHVAADFCLGVWAIGLYDIQCVCVCEMHQCMFETGWLLEESAYIDATPTNLQVPAMIDSVSSV